MDLPQIRLVEFNWGGIEFDPPIKLGGNHWDDTQLRLHCMPGRIWWS